MKYCPHCGGALPGGAVSFCPECGKALPKQRPSGNAKRSSRPPEKSCRLKERKASPKPRNPMDENYDGYYNDVQPLDAGERSEGMDPALLRRVVIIIAGAVCVISLAVILMMLL